MIRKIKVYFCRLVGLAMALALLLAAASPRALAQGSADVTVTFELTLYGDVPEGDAFGVSYGFRTQGGSAAESIVVFCGYGAKVECEGNGTAYRHSTVTNNPELSFGFFRRSGGQGENIVRAQETVTKDMTFQGYYDYRTGTGGFGTGPGKVSVPQQMPGTGGGGSAHSAGRAAVMIALLVTENMSLRHR